ncbi:MAG: methyltransferase domain-containing protein [Caldilinea sp.]|jgi:SAM-dependent methyltransferase
MTTESTMTVPDRIDRLLRELGIKHAHFAGRSLGDLSGLAAQKPGLFASLTLVCPWGLDVDIVSPLAPQLLVFRGESEGYDTIGKQVMSMPDAALAVARNDIPWSDLIARHRDDIVPRLLPFLAEKTSAAGLTAAALHDGEVGSAAGINYRVQGSGPPLVLMPLGLVPSQWDPILELLAENYCTITLGGPHLGAIAVLEERAATAGWRDMMTALVQTVPLAADSTVLEIGCGTGANMRWLAQRTVVQNQIVGVDLNRYFLREATDMARRDGLDDIVQFKEGDALALPFNNDQFDLTLSITVLEEIHADLALAEMIRVTKPGGYVGVIVRAKDVPFFVNLPIDVSIKAKLEHPSAHGSDAGPDGCADATLYSRFHASPLTAVKIFPFLAAFNEPAVLDIFRAWMGELLDDRERAVFYAACERVKADGTFVWSYPHHCAIGVKPTA